MTPANYKNRVERGLWLLTTLAALISAVSDMRCKTELRLHASWKQCIV